MKALGRRIAATVTRGAVRCSAWLGVFGGNGIKVIQQSSDRIFWSGVWSPHKILEHLDGFGVIALVKHTMTERLVNRPCLLNAGSIRWFDKWNEIGNGGTQDWRAIAVKGGKVGSWMNLRNELETQTGDGAGIALSVENSSIPNPDKTADKSSDGRPDKWTDETWEVIAGFAQWILFPLGAAAGIWLEGIISPWINARRWRKRV